MKLVYEQFTRYDAEFLHPECDNGSLNVVKSIGSQLHPYET